MNEIEKRVKYRKKWLSKEGNLEKERKRHREDYHIRVKPLRAIEKKKGIIRCLWCKRILEKLFNGTKYCSERCHSSALDFNKKQKKQKRVRGWSWWNPVEKKACDKCGAVENLEVHHLEYEKNKSVCQVLCRNCHRKIHRLEELV